MHLHMYGHGQCKIKVISKEKVWMNYLKTLKCETPFTKKLHKAVFKRHWVN